MASVRRLILFLSFIHGFYISAQVAGLRQISLEDVHKNYTFYEKEPDELKSLMDGRSYTSLERDGAGKNALVRFDYTSGKALDTLIGGHDLGDLALDNYVLSDDETKALIATEKTRIYRRSSESFNYIFDLSHKTMIPLDKAGKQMNAAFSPDGKKVAFVRRNDIFIKDLITKKLMQVTRDGKKNSIINGACDWVYEEEFEFTQALSWSPDSKRLAFYRFDESKVPQYTIPLFDSLYPTLYTYKYPKAGEINSTVSIQVYDMAGKKTIRVDVGREKDQYIPRIRWTYDPSKLFVIRLNRQQNKMEYLEADAATGSSRVVLAQTDKRYVEIGENTDDLKFLKDKAHFILSSEQDGFRQVYLYDLSGKMTTQLTHGPFDVTAVYGVDEKKHCLYYQSAEPSPLQRMVYSVGLDGQHKRALATAPGTTEASFSTDFSFFIKKYSNANVSPVFSVCDAAGSELRVIEDNAELNKRLKGYAISKTEFIQIPVSDGIMLNASVIKPISFDPRKKYPVFMEVYGGPGSQGVLDAWTYSAKFISQTFVDQGYIVVTVDNRGTGARGADFKKCTYLKLGEIETQDQIASALWLAKLPYVDGSRIGIWGWSFGGYMSSLCITKGADVFKAAIAVAPVTSWRFYDSVYTERFLRTPKENSEGYDNNSPINFADKLKGRFLLIHGTGDDNVHFQNSVVFSEALIQAGKQFSQAYYPNKNHGIYGGNTRLQLFTRITQFVGDNL